jgi:hypothetical protein
VPQANYRANAGHVSCLVVIEILLALRVVDLRIARIRVSKAGHEELVRKRSAVGFFVYAGQVSFFPVFFVNQSGHRPTIVGRSRHTTTQLHQKT